MSRYLMPSVQSLRSTLFVNSAFLIANTLAGSAAGFLFWILAARIYEPAEVGLGAAYIGALTLLTNLGEMGLGVALLRFVPTLGSQQSRFINSALVTVAVSTLLISIIFALGTPLWSPELSALRHSAPYFSLFLLTTLVFGLAQLFDKMFIALQVAHFVFLRNLVSNILRIGLLLLVGHLLDAIGLVLAIGVASLLSFALSSLIFAPRALPTYRLRPTFNWSILRQKVGYTLGNHLSLMLWNAPPLIYPLLIVELLGTQATAYFYTSWMIANILFIVPTAISTAVFANSSGSRQINEHTFWQTMQRTLIGLLPLAGGLSVAAPLLLSIFGPDYVTGGKSLLLCLTASVFPYTITTFTLAYHRLQQNTARVIWLSALVTLLCLLLSIAFGAQYGLVGIGIGWLSGQMLGVVLCKKMPNIFSALSWAKGI